MGRTAYTTVTLHSATAKRRGHTHTIWRTEGIPHPLRCARQGCQLELNSFSRALKVGKGRADGGANQQRKKRQSALIHARGNYLPMTTIGGYTTRRQDNKTRQQESERILQRWRRKLHHYTRRGSKSLLKLLQLRNM